MPKGSHDQTKASGLHFDSQQDALDFASHCVENANRWLSANNIDFAERYENCDVNLALKASIAGESEVCDLVFSAIPTATFSDSERGLSRPGVVDVNFGAAGEGHWDKQLMLVCDRHAVQQEIQEGEIRQGVCTRHIDVLRAVQ